MRYLRQRNHGLRPEVIVHWMGTQISVSSIRNTKQGPVVDGSLVIPWNDQQYSFSEPEALGAWVSDELVRAGISPARTVVSLPRQATVVRTVDLGPVATDEVPGAIALHVEGLQHTLNRPLAYDFRIHSTDEASSKCATVVTCPQAVVDGITHALNRSGFQVAACCLGELALASRLEEATSSDKLLIMAGDVKLDAVLIRAGQPLAALATRMPQDAAAAATAVDQLQDRIAVALPDYMSQTEVPEIHVTGPQARPLADQLQEESSCQVRTFGLQHGFDVLPLAVAEHGRKSGALLDMLHPTLPPDPWQIRKRSWLKRGVVAAAAALLLGAGLYVRHGQLSESLAQSRIRLENTQAVLDHADPIVRKWQFLNDWLHDSFSVTNELLQLSAHLPKEERAYLTRMQIEDLPGEDSAVLRLDGVAKDNRDVMALNRTLLDANYDLRPHGIEPSTRDKTYKAQFRIEAAVTGDSGTD